MYRTLYNFRNWVIELHDLIYRRAMKINCQSWSMSTKKKCLVAQDKKCLLVQKLCSVTTYRHTKLSCVSSKMLRWVVMTLVWHFQFGFFKLALGSKHFFFSLYCLLFIKTFNLSRYLLDVPSLTVEVFLWQHIYIKFHQSVI